MRIVYREAQGREYRFFLPTGLVFNRFMAGVMAKIMQKYAGRRFAPDAAQTYALINAAQDYKKRHPDWVLVETQEADGSYTHIRM